MSTITYLTRIEFGEGEVRRLPEFLDVLGIRKPLVATDAGLAATGLVARVLESVSQAVVFDKTPSNPTEAAVLEAHDLFTSQGCDGVIGFGGGSSIDLAKAIRVLSGHPAPLEQYAAIHGGVRRIQNSMCPMIAIPTTAGTGSEVGRGAIINTASGRKLGILSPFLLPSIALCDPELTYGLPPGLTAATGMDAISHCLETYMAPAFNPPAEAIALHGLSAGLGAIARATEEGKDIAARRDMMIAALEGAGRRSRADTSARRHSRSQSSSRHFECDTDARRAPLQPARHRRQMVRVGAAYGRPTGSGDRGVEPSPWPACRPRGAGCDRGDDGRGLPRSTSGPLPRNQPKTSKPGGLPCPPS
jgi:4-hydroxybutyrate dehydrogenase